MPPTLLSLRRHTLIGWLALLGAAIHVAGLVLVDRTVVEYLKPSAPLYQLAGIAAAAILLALVSSSTAGVRRRLWASHRGFQATHVILGSLLVASIAVHVVATARYAGGRGRRALLVGGDDRRDSDAAAAAPSNRSRSSHAPRCAGDWYSDGTRRRWSGVLALSALAVASLLPHAVGRRAARTAVAPREFHPARFSARQARHGQLSDLSSQLRRRPGLGIVRAMSSQRPGGSQGGRRGALPRLLPRVPPPSAGNAPSATVRSPAAAPVISRPAPAK